MTSWLIVIGLGGVAFFVLHELGTFATLEYWFLKTAFPRSASTGESNGGQSRLRLLFGDEAVASLGGKVVVDFGCGEGNEAIDLARSGAARVIGIDVREEILERARRRAMAAGVGHVCEFTSCPQLGQADCIISIDAFEHFADPGQILCTMQGLLRHGGEVLISFGPPWLHPLGGHLFSVFPWAHMLLCEDALIRWRSDFKSDGARRFHEVEGGLNCMTIARFERLVQNSGLRVKRFTTVPIRSLTFAHTRITREFTTAIVSCVLARTS